MLTLPLIMVRMRARAVDEMGVRIDELENSIGELMAQAGIDDEPGAHPEGAPPPSQPAAQAS